MDYEELQRRMAEAEVRYRKMSKARRYWKRAYRYYTFWAAVYYVARALRTNTYVPHPSQLPTR